MKTYKWFFLILVSGVFCACSGTSEEELIGDWQRRQSVPGTGRCHAATFVIGNKGYVIGGYNGFNALRREVEEFDHSVGKKGVWNDERRYLPDHIPARQQAVGFSLYGKGYVGTGWAFLGTDNETTLNDFWQFDPEEYDPTIEDEEERLESWERCWKEVAPLPAAARRGAIAFSLEIPKGSNKWFGFVGCGFTGDSDNEYLFDFWKFDPNEVGVEGKIGKWTPLPLADKYPGGKRAGAVVFVIDNKAYICLGENPTNLVDFWVFDPNAPSGEHWFELRKMTNADRDEDYDDDYGPLARAYGVAYVAMANGQLRGHIVGGKSGYGYTNWEYDHNPVNEGGDLWIQRTRFYNNNVSQTREGMISFSFPNSGRAFVGLGRSGVTNWDDFWEFIPLIEDYTYDDI